MSDVADEATRACGRAQRELAKYNWSRGLRLSAGRIIIGTVAAPMLTPLMGNMLCNVSPRDPLASGLACFVMGDSRADRPFSCPRGAPHASIPFKLYERECFGH